jgi:signal transduction histidine kinase
MKSLSLSTKTAVALSALVLVAVLSSAASLVYGWRVHAADRLVAHDVSEMVVSANLWAALRQKYIALGNYLTEGAGPQQIKALHKAEAAFNARLAEREAGSDSPGELSAVPKLRQVANRYEAKCREILALHDSGAEAAARDAYLSAMAQLYREGTSAIAELIAIDEREVNAALTAGRRETSWLDASVIAGAVLTALLGASTIWLLFSSVFRPIRQMAADCRSCLADGLGAPKPETAGKSGDLTLLGYYLRTLMTEVAATRSDLEKNRVQSVQSERLAAIGNVVACVAHEIKNALTSIGGFARFIERRPDDADRVRQEAQIILKVAGRLERMVRETMDYSRPVRVEPVVQSLNSLVGDALVAVVAQAPEGVALEIDLDPAAPKVPFDAGYMEQVVANLVGNAVEAVGARGNVRVATKPHQGGAALIVRDDGPGIPPEQQARIFEPFFTTKKKGNGLGLAICRQIVVSHGGEISFQSAPGKGTTFEVTLPPARGAAGAGEFFPTI